MPKLIIQEGYKVSGEYDIPEGETIIGRENGATLVLDGHLGVSRQHCRLFRTGNVVTVEDLNSRNGTFVNSHIVSGKIVLNHLDNIQIHDVLLVYSAIDVSEMDNTGNLEDVVAERPGEYVSGVARKIMENIGRVIKGKDDVIRNVIITLLSDGHILLEDVPGVGKTKLALALSRSLCSEFKRIQFTPDMLPNDVTGISMYDESKKSFIFMPGPVFGNIILADEINRGTPRVQSSLLECMAESMITVDGNPHILRKPFFVIATQNPTDFQGTYPLPEAQLDRFLMRFSMGYPTKETEKEILANQAESDPINTITHVADSSDVLRCQSLVRKLKVSDQVRDYIATIVEKTRSHPALAYGCSPRASLALLRASQALAAVNGRDYVMPRDVRDLAVQVLAHRVPLKLQARAEWTDTAHVLRTILDELPIDQWEEMEE